MKENELKFLLISSFLVLSLSCASLKTSNGSLNWSALISDAQFGVAAACDTGEIPSDDCKIVNDALMVASTIITKNPINSVASIKQTLTDVEARLSVSSSARPYLDWLIALT